MTEWGRLERQRKPRSIGGGHRTICTRPQDWGRGYYNTSEILSMRNKVEDGYLQPTILLDRFESVESTRNFLHRRISMPIDYSCVEFTTTPKSPRYEAIASHELRVSS